MGDIKKTIQETTDEKLWEQFRDWLARHANDREKRRQLHLRLKARPPVRLRPVAPSSSEITEKEELLSKIHTGFTSSEVKATGSKDVFDGWALAVLFYMPVDRLLQISKDQDLIQSICTNAEDFVKLCESHRVSYAAIAYWTNVIVHQTYGGYHLRRYQTLRRKEHKPGRIKNNLTVRSRKSAYRLLDNSANGHYLMHLQSSDKLPRRPKMHLTQLQNIVVDPPGR